MLPTAANVANALMLLGAALSATTKYIDEQQAASIGARVRVNHAIYRYIYIAQTILQCNHI